MTNGVPIIKAGSAAKMIRFALSGAGLAALTVIVAFAAQGQTPELSLSSTKPRYCLKLNLNEFSVLNAAEVDGLLKYGGSGDFKVQMAKEGNEVTWTVTIDNPRLMELLGIFVGEKTVKLVQGLDTDKIDPSEKIALRAIKSLSQKLEYAQKNPVWDKTKISGGVLQDGTNWVIQTKEGKLRLVGDKVAELKTRNGMAIVAEGYVKVPGQFELTRYLDKRLNTLELFVMSLCPFSQRAETTIYSFLEQTSVNPKPNLEVHYIFYKQKKDGKDVYVSLHGEEEVMENLVQIVIRDRFPHFLGSYGRLRATSGKLPWQKLAEQVGLSKTDIAEIQDVITTQRDFLIQKEYDYVTGQYEIYDGSPTYVWESERVADLSKIEAFKEMTGSPQETCAK